MKQVAKTIKYIFDDMLEIDAEIALEWYNGWRVVKRSDAINSYVHPPKKEIEITYLLRFE